MVDSSKVKTLSPWILSMTFQRFFSEVSTVFLRMHCPSWSRTAKVDVDEWASRPIKYFISSTPF